MPERPKPPEPYETWIEWCIGRVIEGDGPVGSGLTGCAIRVIARNELADLREKAAAPRVYPPVGAGDG